MAELDNATVAKLTDVLDRLLKRLGGNSQAQDSSGAGGGTSGGSTLPNEQALTLMRKAGDALGKVATEGTGAVAVFEAIKKNKDPVIAAFEKIAAYSKVPGAPIAGQILKESYTTGKGAVETGRGTDMTKMYGQEARTRVDYADFKKYMDSAGVGAQGAGAIQEDRVNNLYKALETAQKAQAGNIASGATSPEVLAKSVVLASQQMKGTNLNTEEGQAKLVKRSQELSDEIDSTAKRIGVDRRVIADETAARLKDGYVQATLAAAATDEQRQGIIKSQVALSGFGKDVQDLALEINNYGGAVTKESQATAVRLGPAYNDLREAMMRLKGATTENERVQAQAALDRAKQSINERQNSPEAAEMAVLSRAFPEEELLQTFKTGFEQNKEAGGYGSLRNQGLSPAEAQRSQNAQVYNLRQGNDQYGGAPTPGMQIMQGILEGNQKAATTAGKAVDALNDYLNKTPEAVRNFRRGIGDGATVPKVETPETTPSTTEDKKKKQPQPPNEGGRTTPKDKRDLGTLGSTGSMFEPKDIVALLHKGERVLNPQENKDLTSLFGMVSKINPTESTGSLGGALKDLKPNVELPTAAETKIASTTPNFNENTDTGITLKDLHDSLEQLNKGIMTMVSHTADMRDSTKETADMSGKLTGNRLAV